MAMVESNDVFWVPAIDNKLDGTNYPLWDYMICHVLVAKELWNVVQAVGKRHVVVNTNVDGTDFVDHPTHAHASISVVPNAEQLCWDGRDAQAHALIALFVKRAIIPHIRSCKTTKDVWDTLTTLYQARNEARVAYLRK